jgi:hypothetical protein
MFITNVQLRLSTPQMVITNVQLRLSTPQMFITNLQLTIYTAHILSQMYSLDYLFNKFDHKCTAWIIYSKDFITNVQLGLSTQEIFITNARLRLSTPQIVPQMYTLDYLLNRFHHKCTAWIIYSTDLITNVHLK